MKRLPKLLQPQVSWMSPVAPSCRPWIVSAAPEALALRSYS